MEKVDNATKVEELAEWAETLQYGDLSEDALTALKARLLDSIGCAIGALEGEPVKAIRKMTEKSGGNPIATLIGGGKTSLENAAFYNGALIRYLDFNDAYLAKNETCHPSDNIAPVLAAAESANASGKELLLALAIAYQVQCRLSDIAPVRDKGFDHTVQGAYGAAAGTARALGLNKQEIANAIAIAGTSYNSLRVTRTGELSNWKGLAYPNTAKGAAHAAMLASYGITGPREVFEGNKGFMDSIAGIFDIDWSKEDAERVTATITKQFNAEIHSQASIEGILELRNEINIDPDAVKQIRLHTFDVAYHIIGGGEEGGKKDIQLKEEADHSLPYMLAAAFIDGQVMPEQYDQGRINKADIQHLLQKVEVIPDQEYSDRFPAEMACRIEIETFDGEMYAIEKNDYKGFTTRPADWSVLMEKYHGLTNGRNEELIEEIAETVKNIEHLQVTELTSLLEKIK